IDTMFAACTDSLFLTTDGWASYTTPVALQSYDIEFKPDDPQTIYVACQGSLQRSTTGINGFSDITANLVQTSITPNSLMGRMAIAVTPDDPDRLYVIISETRNNGSGLLSFQFSTDGGDSFVETINQSYNILAANDPLTSGTGQGNYDLAIWADPGNANTVLVGGVNLWKSNSGGAVWEQVMHWENSPPEYTHADIHAIESLNGDIVVGSDGGLYLSEDGGYEWFNRGRGLGITQYYHFDVYVGFLDLPYLLGGAQDNGTSAGIGFADNLFEMAGGGDGFRCFQGIYDGKLARYRSSQNGKLYFQVQEADDFWLEDHITPDSELDGQDQGMGTWDTPYQPSPNNFNDVIAGYDDLYFSTDNGDDWAMLPVNHPSGNYDGSELITQIG
ncbi:MAG: hypothetical protein R3330_17310, partial [Saprospiraceae bacterium]|nr:hypothetical protein [Saprospiraceae bacterium]